MNLHDPKYRFLKRRISMISFRRVLKSWIRIRDIKISLSQPRLPVRPQMSVRPMTNANSDLKTRPSLSLSLSLSLIPSHTHVNTLSLSVSQLPSLSLSHTHSNPFSPILRLFNLYHSLFLAVYHRRLSFYVCR